MTYSILKKYYKRFTYAFLGLYVAFRDDKNFRGQLWLGVLVIPTVIYFGYPLSHSELFLLGISYIHILITELQNSALENTLDHLHPDKHNTIKISKDMMAGSVLLAGLFFCLIVGSIILTARHLVRKRPDTGTELRKCTPVHIDFFVFYVIILTLSQSLSFLFALGVTHYENQDSTHYRHSRSCL
jgi:undecaprenol kinase